MTNCCTLVIDILFFSLVKMEFLFAGINVLKNALLLSLIFYLLKFMYQNTSFFNNLYCSYIITVVRLIFCIL